MSLSQPSSTESGPAADGVAVPRHPGRPRDGRADHAILDATLELAASVGLAGLTMDAVAARAGVSKATIYRRWSSKEALVLDAWIGCFPHESIPDTGTLKGDLIANTQMLRDAVSTGTFSRVLPQMVAAARVNDELGEVYHEFIAQRRARTRAVLDRAVERGELPEGADLELIHDLITGPLFYRALMSGLPSSDELTAEVVDVVVAGVVATASSSQRPSQ